ncbi:MAG: hypothetical protein JWP97_4232 [Labilithrix sp.]|nr:hypothetical protein [Labilithrix sp.]
MALVITSLASVAGCSAKALEPGAERVMVTHLAPADGCIYVGSVIGEQGGSVAGKYTSNKRLAEGALNDMKNRAHAMGANYVLLEDTHAGSTFTADRNGGSGGQTDVTHMGNAFRCPDHPSTAAADVVVVGM